MSMNNGVPRTLDDVARYLKQNYGLSDRQAIELVQRRQAIYLHGVEMGSYTYYIGDEMVAAEQQGASNSTTSLDHR